MAKTIKVNPEEKQPFVPGSVTFTFEKKKYAVQIGLVNIPEVGIRTAEELAVDDKAQEVLLKIEGQTVATEVV
jgi:hypothetical protein